MGIPEYLPYIQFFGQLALISAAAFAGYQLILTRRERNEHGALEVLEHVQSPEFRQAYAKVWTLPLDATPDEVRSQGAEMEDAIDCVMMSFESLGVMVHNRIVPLELVDQVIGGFLRESWRRSKQYILQRREELGSRRYGEWYQWLAEHLAVESRRSVGAYEAFRHWEP